MELNKEIVSIVIPSVLLVAWFVRLEAKVLVLEKSHHEHKADTKEMNNKMWLKIESLSQDMSAIKEALARIEENIKYIRNHDQ